MKDFGIPARVARFETAEELSALLKKYGETDVYQSTYERTEAKDYGTAIIDKLFFDLEFKGSKHRPPDYFLKFLEAQARKLAGTLAGLGCRVDIIDSGRGYHVFAHLDRPAELVAKGRALRECCKIVLTLAPCPASDSSVIGDLARIRRIVGTVNSKTGTRCQLIDTLEPKGPCALRILLESLDARQWAKSQSLERNLPSYTTWHSHQPCEFFTRAKTVGAESGERNSWAIFLVNRLRRDGVPEDSALRWIVEWGQRCRPRVVDDSLGRMVERVYRRTDGYSPCGIAERLLGGPCASCPRRTQ